MTSGGGGFFVRCLASVLLSMSHKAEWHGVLLAESDKCVEVEGNWYFPPDSLKKEFFVDSTHTSHCGWKGHCNYYDIKVKDVTNKNAAWVYRDPLPAAANIKNYVAFWKGVLVT